MTRFRAATKNHSYRAAIQAEMAQAKVLGQNGTPFFVIDGHKVEGALSFEELKPLIEAPSSAAPAAAPNAGH